MYEAITTPPLVMPIDIFAELIADGDLKRAYKIVNTDPPVVQTLPVPGRKRVLTSSVERAFGVRLTVLDFRDAEARAAVKRQRRSQYLKTYNEAR